MRKSEPKKPTLKEVLDLLEEILGEQLVSFSAFDRGNELLKRAGREPIPDAE